MKPYDKDYTDKLRDIANGLFLSGYVLLMFDQVLLGASLYLLGEFFLTPHSLRARSWTTIAASIIFGVASLYKIILILFI